MQGGLFSDSQESRVQGAKRSDMYSFVLLGGRFADAQESRLQAAKILDMGTPSCWEVGLQMLRNCVFWPPNAQIRAMPSCRGLIS